MLQSALNLAIFAYGLVVQYVFGYFLYIKLQLLIRSVIIMYIQLFNIHIQYIYIMYIQNNNSYELVPSLWRTQRPQVGSAIYVVY